MRRAVIFFALLCGVGLLSEAHGQVEVSYGLKAGPSATAVFADVEDATYRLRPGLTATAFFEVRLGRSISIQPEAGYVQRGFVERFEEELDPTNGTVDPEPIQTSYRFDYATVPVLVKARLGTGGSSPYLLAGPRIDFLLNTARSLDAPVPPPPQVPPDHTERYRSAALGATVGFGLGPGIVANVPLVAELRYHLDVTDSHTTDVDSMHNWGIDLVFGLHF